MRRHPGSGYVLAIGIFDGVHRGHRAILKRAVVESRRLGAVPAALTFPTHPSRVLAPSRPVPLIQPFDDRRRLIRELGIKRIFALHFSKRLSKLSPAGFVKQVLFRHWNVRGVVVGRNFRFGRDRAGGVAELTRLLAPLGARVWAVAPVRCGPKVVQSTAIRRALLAGNLSEAECMLGRAPVLTGQVRRGEGRGADLGARTVNVKLLNELTPRLGVYAGWIRPSASERRRPAVMNLGVAPTLGAGRDVLLEVHVLDGGRVDIRSGASLEASLANYLRPERKFPSALALRRAIQKDVFRARKLLMK